MIVTYKLTCNDGVYRCNDVDITVEEWIRALYAIQENSFKCLVMLFYMPNHECACYDAGKKYGLHPSSFIAPVTSIAKKAMDIASRFEVEDFDNNANKRYWIVPMQEGYESKKGPDFITFLRHHIAQIENQRVTSNLWVALGVASKKCVPLFHVCTQET